jgi:hypothetical protein
MDFALFTQPLERGGADLMIWIFHYIASAYYNRQDTCHSIRINRENANLVVFSAVCGSPDSARIPVLIHSVFPMLLFCP